MKYLQYLLFFAVLIAIRYWGEKFMDYLGKERLIQIARVGLVLIFVNVGIFIFGLVNLIYYPGTNVKSSSQTYTLENPKVEEETRKTPTSVEKSKRVFVGKEQARSFGARMTYGQLWRGLQAGDWYTIVFACTVFGMLFFMLSLFTCIFIYAYLRK